MGREMQKHRSPVMELSEVQLRGAQWGWETQLVVRSNGRRRTHAKKQSLNEPLSHSPQR